MKLTTEQIRELAPEWASHYKDYNDGDVMFESDKFYQWYDNGLFMVKRANSAGVSKNSIPIPRKLPNNTAVLRSEVKTQADLDAMVKVAEYNGFDMSEQKDCILSDYDDECVSLTSLYEAFQNMYIHKDLNIITLKEFLSYGEKPMSFAEESKLPETNAATPMPPVKPPAVENMTMEEWEKRRESQPPIDQIADIMRRENITSINLSMSSDGKVTGSFDVESGVE